MAMRMMTTVVDFGVRGSASAAADAAAAAWLGDGSVRMMRE